jgi:hypothetical protein
MRKKKKKKYVDKEKWQKCHLKEFSIQNNNRRENINDK